MKHPNVIPHSSLRIYFLKGTCPLFEVCVNKATRWQKMMLLACGALWSPVRIECWTNQKPSRSLVHRHAPLARQMLADIRGHRGNYSSEVHPIGWCRYVSSPTVMLCWHAWRQHIRWRGLEEWHTLPSNCLEHTSRATNITLHIRSTKRNNYNMTYITTLKNNDKRSLRKVRTELSFLILFRYEFIFTHRFPDVCTEFLLSVTPHPFMHVQEVFDWYTIW